MDKLVFRRNCFICKNPVECREANFVCYFSCSRCGRFCIESNLLDDFVGSRFYKELHSRWIANTSGFIRERQDILIDQALLENFKRLDSPSILEKIYKLLSWLDIHTEYCGKPVLVGEGKEYEAQRRDAHNGSDWLHLLPPPYSICWVYGEEEFRYLLNYLHEMRFISCFQEGRNFKLTMRPEGYLHLDKYRTNSSSNIGFCAIHFHEALTPAWIEAIEPAIRLAGYEPKRIDKHPHNGGVVDEILALIRRSKFIIADLTHERGGVYFEAGFAKGLGIEVIFTCRKDYFDKPKEDLNKGLHFDVNHFNFLFWNPSNYPEFKTRLQDRIEATLGKGRNVMADQKEQSLTEAI